MCERTKCAKLEQQENDEQHDQLPVPPALTKASLLVARQSIIALSRPSRSPMFNKHLKNLTGLAEEINFSLQITLPAEY